LASHEIRLLKLINAAVIRAADRWLGIPMGEFEQRQLRAPATSSPGSRRPRGPGRRPEIGDVGPKNSR